MRRYPPFFTTSNSIFWAFFTTIFISAILTICKKTFLTSETNALINNVNTKKGGSEADLVKKLMNANEEAIKSYKK